MSTRNNGDNYQLAQLCCNKQGAGRTHGQADGNLVSDMKLGECGSHLRFAMALELSDLPHVIAGTKTRTASFEITPPNIAWGCSGLSA